MEGGSDGQGKCRYGMKEKWGKGNLEHGAIKGSDIPGTEQGRDGRAQGHVKGQTDQ